MTDPKASDVGSSEAEPATTSTAPLSRRAILRGATLAAPAVLTLNSNTAMGWAIASGTIGTRSATGGTGSAMCLDTTSVGSEIKQGVYAVGNPPYAEVVNVPGTVQYRKREANWTGGNTELTPEQVCTQGGYIEYKSSGGWTKLKGYVDPARYPLVSSTAVASIGARVVQRNISEL